MSDISTIKVGSTTYDIKDASARENLLYLVEDNGTTTAGTWLGKCSLVDAPFDGMVIKYKIPSVGGASGGTTLNLNGKGAKNIYLRSTTKLTTHFSSGTYLVLTYNGSGWYLNNSYYSDTKMTQAFRSTNENRPILLSAGYTADKTSGSSASTAYWTNKVYVNPSTGALSAKSFVEDGTALSSKYAALASDNTWTGINTFGTVNVGVIKASLASLTIGDSSNHATSVNGRIYGPNGFDAGSLTSFYRYGDGSIQYQNLIDTTQNKTFTLPSASGTLAIDLENTLSNQIDTYDVTVNNQFIYVDTLTTDGTIKLNNWYSINNTVSGGAKVIFTLNGGNGAGRCSLSVTVPYSSTNPDVIRFKVTQTNNAQKYYVIHVSNVRLKVNGNSLSGTNNEAIASDIGLECIQTSYPRHASIIRLKNTTVPFGYVEEVNQDLNSPVPHLIPRSPITSLGSSTYPFGSLYVNNINASTFADGRIFIPTDGVGSETLATREWVNTNALVGTPGPNGVCLSSGLYATHFTTSPGMPNTVYGHGFIQNAVDNNGNVVKFKFPVTSGTDKTLATQEWVSDRIREKIVLDVTTWPTSLSSSIASVSVPYDTLSKCAAGKAYIVFRYISGSSVLEYEFTFYSKSESSYPMSNTTNYTEYYTFRNATGYSAYAYVSYTDAMQKPSTSTLTISYGSYYTGTPKSPTYSGSQYNLGYYYNISSSSSINTTTYLYTGEYGLYLAATCTGQPYSWGSAQYCHLKTESSYYTNSTSYSKAIKQTLTVLGAQKVFERYVTYSSSWKYGAWKEITHNFAKTVVQPLSSTYTYLLSNLVPSTQTGYYRLTISSYNGADTFAINNSGTAVMSNIVQLDGIYQYSGGTWMPTGRVTVVSSTGVVSCMIGSSLNSTAAVAGGSTTSQTFYITAQQVG